LLAASDHDPAPLVFANHIAITMTSTTRSGRPLGIPMLMDWSKGALLPDAQLLESVKTLGQLQGIFGNEEARRKMDPSTVVYRVQAWCPVPEGTEGALFWGTTVVESGHVDSEFFMTHGHFHQKRNRTEYYGTVEGHGALILMDENRDTRMEPMSAGSLHFIPPNTAHRVANTGMVPLRFVACWPGDAGHDYESIRKNGFGARLLNIDGSAALMRSDGGLFECKT
jgi:glucose-6-phosphate isomerase